MVDRSIHNENLFPSALLEKYDSLMVSKASTNQTNQKLSLAAKLPENPKNLNDLNGVERALVSVVMNYLCSLSCQVLAHIPVCRHIHTNPVCLYTEFLR